jgi:hypothetical protein|tara:strand:+ start:43 stop:393 length:351 start_codon:yes stop_codon:yes gene_type:complete
MAHYEEIQIDQGADVAVEVHLVETCGQTIKDLSGYTAAAKLKKTYTSDSDDTTDFTITIVEDEGIVTMSLTNTQTDALKAGRYVYDLEIMTTDSDNVTLIERVLEGRAVVTPSVTK